MFGQRQSAGLVAPRNGCVVASLGCDGSLTSLGALSFSDRRPRPALAARLASAWVDAVISEGGSVRNSETSEGMLLSFSMSTSLILS